MKLRVPEGCAAVSHNGEPLSIMRDQSVEVDDALFEFLAPHGFMPWLAGMREVPHVSDALNPIADAGTSMPVDADDIGALNRNELFAILRATGVSVSLPITNLELRAVARRALKR